MLVCEKFLDICGVLLGHFDFDMDVVVSKAIAADTSDPLPRQTDPLVCLDASRDLGEKKYAN